MKRVLWAFLYVAVACPQAGHADVAGTYIDLDNPSIALVLNENQDGSLSGSFEGLSEAVPLAARPTASGFSGSVGRGAEAASAQITIDGDVLILVLAVADETETHRFSRTGPAEGGAPAVPPAPAAAPAARTEAAAPAGARNVTVNDRRLSDTELANIEQQYRVRIEDAAYWYDPFSGAWGIKGGPTRGFIYSGLNIGGPLKADASGGGTNVFINGRELHPLDVSGLTKCTPVNPGRYWVAANGIGGYEGGPASFDLVSLCKARSGGGWVCDGGSCGTTRTVTGPYAVTSEGDGRAGVYTDQGLILTPN